MQASPHKDHADIKMGNMEETLKRCLTWERWTNDESGEEVWDQFFNKQWHSMPIYHVELLQCRSK